MTVDMQKGKKLSILSIAFVAVLTLVLWSVSPARASTVPELVAQIDAVSGLTATSSGSEITVTGNATATSTLMLDIDPGVTINWEANYSGALSARYVLVLQGAGTFNLTGSVSNSSYGAINVTGAGGTKLDINGGALLSAGGGYTLSIAADNVIANINGGMVSRSGGTNSAINVGSGLNDVKINIDGGTVSSISGGNAINDSGSNTKITISGGGTVVAGSASAIRSTGAAAEVIVLNSVVTNAGTVAANATIYMTAVSNNQVTISGTSIVENTYAPVSSAQAAYAIQTGGNVTVIDNAEVAAYSRAINLVGTNSIATISGGKVIVTGTGENNYAISTATTDPGSVVNAKVLVTGGWVSATAGNAIHVTGANSVVTVSGGWVTAETGRAINATNSTVTVTVNGGFVFAYGTTRDDVVHATSPIFLYTSPDNAVVLTWDRQTAASLVPAGELILYAQQTRDDLTTWIGISAGTMWQNHPNLGAGIFYTNGVNTGFFPISGVEVYVDHGLIFQYDTTEYKIFRDINGNGARDVQDLQFSYAGPLIPPKFEINTNTLYLNDFRWNTNRQYALTVHDNATISLGGSNMLTSIDNYTSDPSVISPQSYGLNIDPGV
ncbi:hypothetical protein FWC31_01440, partial [Candidatus Saccharibacteria bacterium]|nr:hypothetical protein [Candidatus Saccharibacteria bacterium]